MRIREDPTLSLPRWRQNELGTRMHSRLWRGKRRKRRGRDYSIANPLFSPSPLPALTTLASVCNVGTDVNDINDIFRAII